MQYNLIMKFKTGDLYKGVREVEDSVNGFMADFGFSEKIFWESEAPIFTLNVSQPLTPEAKAQVMQIVNESFEKQGKLNMVCTDIVPA